MRREENQVCVKSQKPNFCEGTGVMEGNTYIVRYCFKGREAEMEKEMATHSSILAWRIHGQGNLVGYRSWSHKKLDMTEAAALSIIKSNLSKSKFTLYK